MQKRILISGCSGGGKSTLLAALKSAGHRVVAEPGLRIVRAAQAARDDTTLPWVDLAAFARCAIDMAKSDLDSVASVPGLVFFDRGLIDAAVALEHATAIPIETVLGQIKHYTDPVFLAPPWPELFCNDAERQHDFAQAKAEYERLHNALDRLGHKSVLLPKTTVENRLTFVLDKVGQQTD